MIFKSLKTVKTTSKSEHSLQNITKVERSQPQSINRKRSFSETSISNTSDRKSNVSNSFEDETEASSIYNKIPKKKVLSKKERRLLKLKSKKHSSLVISLLPLWEELRCDDTPLEKRFELIQKILSKSKGKLFDLCLAHDTSRILETVIQYGTQAQKWQCFTELRTHFRLLAQSKYAKFVLIKLIKCGDKEHRLEVFKVFRSNFARLVKHKHASELVDMLYNDYASAIQRGEILQEFYGNSYALKLSENRVYSLKDALKLNPDKASVILRNLTVLLIDLVNKGLNKYSIVQHLLLEYLDIVVRLPKDQQLNQSILPEPSETVVPVLIDDVQPVDTTCPETIQDHLAILLESLVEGHIVPMLHTRDGVRVALQVLWASNNRLRKVLLKNLKTCISSIALNEHGHLFLIGLLDAIDDIVLLKKTLIKELLEDLEVLVAHPNSRKVLLYALSPRDRRHFSPQLIDSVFGAGNFNPHTKKPLGLRALELRSPCNKLLPSLLRLANEKLMELFVGNPSVPDDLPSKDRGRLVLLTEILIRSSSFHLDPEFVLRKYKRTPDEVSSYPDMSYLLALNNPVDRLEFDELRKTALEQVILKLLVPEFHPVGLTQGSSNSNTATKLIGVAADRNELRAQRRKLALHLVEKALAKQQNPNIKPFIMNEDSVEENGEAMDISIIIEKQNEKMPFLERPEGQLLVRRILVDEKNSKQFIFSSLVMDLVSAENLRAWTTCNRSCFILVNLYELGNASICAKLRECLAPCLDSLKISPLPGAAILVKHLTNP